MTRNRFGPGGSIEKVFAAVLCLHLEAGITVATATHTAEGQTGTHGKVRSRSRSRIEAASVAEAEKRAGRVMSRFSNHESEVGGDHERGFEFCILYFGEAVMFIVFSGERHNFEDTIGMNGFATVAQSRMKLKVEHF